MRALLGLLVLSAYLKSNHLSSKELFDEKNLWCCIQGSHESPSSYVTIDEQLLGFRGRCPFRMYIPNKLSKYGIKIVLVCDVSSKYMFDAMPYLGKSTNTNGSSRNITMDNWFTSIKLADDLLAPPYNLTMVGTIRKNKRDIPPEMLATKNRDPGSSKFCFDKEKVLVSYTPKKNKNVLLLSTMHEGCSVSKTSGNPEIIETYNQTKGSVDTLDQMCSNMSYNRSPSQDVL
ncbi:hypothetical protein NQ315_015334 [Exocentrus adspersus]|uniref:PiggyBac transposable element-derived protein domain-containing protein n=1 Tax=Exocentrus adspersus TaxID=1586481 RepID=A0AAV8V6C3_9CUCU|nr:hypothetical protein NQ315_015334 [Exocentrus adspersus]